jgi:hypothetical protein
VGARAALPLSTPLHPVSSSVGGAPVLLDEHVHSVHLSDDHAAAQLIERLAWAINDAEDAEQRRTQGRGPSSKKQPARGHRRSAPRSRALARA